MTKVLRKVAGLASFTLLLAGAALAQTSSLEGDVKGEDGEPIKGALVKIERTDIKGNYKVKTDKKGHYFHAGLPLGTYKIILEVEGKDVDYIDKVRSRLGDPVVNNFDLQRRKAQQAQRQAVVQKAAQTGQISKEASREMSPEEKKQMEAQIKAQQAAMAKNKELNDAFNQGMENLKNKQYAESVAGFDKAVALEGGKQYVIYANMAEAYMGLSTQKTGAEMTAAMDKGLEAFGKAIELKPEDASTHNNYALALAKGKKFPEAQAELQKAATLDPPNAGKYFYNLGAVLVNTGQSEAAGEAFKKAIDADPKYADAQYQYGVYLVGKATTTADGKIIPPPGTVEAFQKYLELRPDGQFADGAKGMIQTLGSSVQTEYKNPNAPAQKKTTKKK
jgi:tetratricopeptide (TPR) repeat protein